MRAVPTSSPDARPGPDPRAMEKPTLQMKTLRALPQGHQLVVLQCASDSLQLGPGDPGDKSILVPASRPSVF